MRPFRRCCWRSELFGYRKGAFTGAQEDRAGLFERCQGGTLFLDEIGEISPAFQSKLLRVIQEGELRPVGAAETRRTDCRLVTATNRDLRAEVRAGRFREDLFYRLATVEVAVPSLRERPDDIPLLARTILEEAAADFGKAVPRLPEEAIELMRSYHWPGNVRELQNEIQRMVVMTEGELKVSLLSPWIRGVGSDGDPKAGWEGSSGGDGTLQERVSRMEARVLKDTLARHGGSKTRAAEKLGLSRVGLRSKLERHGLSGEAAGVAS